MRTISFIAANYVGRMLKYDGVEDWNHHDQATIRGASAEHFRAIARDVADAGFRHIDIWTAHAHWRHHESTDLPERIKAICQEFGLGITSYVGGLVVSSPADLEAPFRFMTRFGSPIFAGGMWGVSAPEMSPLVNDICGKYDVRWAFENHPENSPREILAKIDGGRHERVGVALDTGWCGTQGMDALEAVHALRDKLFIVHLKDVTKAGAHETCALGEGIVPVERVVRYLVDSRWEGTIGIEHEPYDRDPMPEVKRSLERLRQWLA